MATVVNRSEFARIVNRSPRQVSNWIKDGMPAEGTGKKGHPISIDTGKAIWWLIAKEAERQSGSGSAEGTKNSEELRLLSARADKAETEAARSREEVVPVEDIQDVLNEVAVIYASQLDAVASRNANELAGLADPGEVRHLLFGEVRKIRQATAEKLQAYAGSLITGVSGSGDGTAAADA
ncbi:MAG: terminase small subunit [Candidatus Sedimenticola sp. (ex Thyasira tokunagai)]